MERIRRGQGLQLPIPDSWAPAEGGTRRGLQSGHAQGAGHAGTCSSQGLPEWGAWT